MKRVRVLYFLTKHGPVKKTMIPIAPSTSKQKELPPHLDDDFSLRLPCPNESQQPLTIFVRHNVLHSKQSEFNNWCKEIYAIAGTYPGFINSEVIKLVCYDDSDNYNIDNSCCDVMADQSDLGPNRISDTYVCIVRFHNYTFLKRWIDSADRKMMLRRTYEFSNDESMYSYHSLEHWFPSDGNDTSQASLNLPKKHGPPPKRKMILIVTSVMYLQSLWIPKVTRAIFPEASNYPNIQTYAMGLLNTFLIVALVTYVVLPITTRLFGFWLFPYDNYFDKLKELIPSFGSTWLSKMIKIAQREREPRNELSPSNKSKQ
jgi:antibiotic biosynthesis monooxygenase (ABM) superfamily enzyme